MFHVSRRLCVLIFRRRNNRRKLNEGKAAGLRPLRGHKVVRPLKHTAVCAVLTAVMIMQIFPAAAWQSFAAEVSSSYKTSDDITVSEGSGSSIDLDLPANDDFRYIRTAFMDSSGQLDSVTSSYVSHGMAEVSTAGLDDGTYYLQISRSQNGRAYTNLITGKSGFIIRISDGKPEVRQSPVLYQYMEYYVQKDVSAEALYYYLQPSFRVQSGVGEIVNKAAEITSGISGAYEKAEAVANWVSSNIYYDLDAAADNSMSTSVSADALGTLRSGHAVCEGYANLTTALLRASGIPARTCVGYGLIDSDDEWSQYKASGSAGENHAWTEAYLKGRWIEIDATWNSRNVYYKKSGISGTPENVYFDNTPQFFAYGHLQLRADDFSTNYIKLTFADLDKDSWSYKYIRFAVNNDIMHGNGDGTFVPSGTTTQAMFITILSYAAGENIKPSSTGNWYDSFDEWAESAGLTKGIVGYDPSALITREQMAVMLHNFLEIEGINPISAVSGDFTDIDEAALWARSDISDLKRWGFLSGRGDGTFDPKATFTRAESAVIITLVEDMILRDYLNT